MFRRLCWVCFLALAPNFLLGEREGDCKYPLANETNFNNETHFGVANVAMPHVHSRSVACSTVGISNSGMHLANTSMAVVARRCRG
jgi:hypothetical protein